MDEEKHPLVAIDFSVINDNATIKANGFNRIELDYVGGKSAKINNIVSVTSGKYKAFDGLKTSIIETSINIEYSSIGSNQKIEVVKYYNL